MSRLRVLVVGAGHMGRLHAGKVAALREELELAGVVDRHPERAEAVAQRFGARAATDFRELAPGADAAIAAIPTVAHHAVVRELLALGLDVLVEKPIAATLAEAEALLAQARASGRVLQVGHLEWFNPALRAIAPAVRRPRYVEAQRLGPFPGRATDVDVVRDLMIHDLDVVQRLVGEEPDRVEGVGAPVLSRQLDVASARLRFPGGCVATLCASRVSPASLRTIRFFQSEGCLSVDFLGRAAAILRRRVGGEGEPVVDVEPLRCEGEDALAAQLRDFAAAVRARRDAGRSAESALRALRTALRVIESMPALDGPR
jgi:predicted dehydrogenase